jgi:hypothetical protein
MQGGGIRSGNDSLSVQRKGVSVSCLDVHSFLFVLVGRKCLIRDLRVGSFLMGGVTGAGSIAHFHLA